MNQETRLLGRTWVQCCMSYDTYHELDIQRFIIFVRALYEDGDQMVPSDIATLVMECNKGWCEEAVEAFVERWFDLYEKKYVHMNEIEQVLENFKSEYLGNSNFSVDYYIEKEVIHVTMCENQSPYTSYSLCCGWSIDAVENVIVALREWENTRLNNLL